MNLTAFRGGKSSFMYGRHAALLPFSSPPLNLISAYLNAGRTNGCLTTLPLGHAALW